MSAKVKSLQLILDKLDKTYGKGAVMKLGDEVVEQVEAISSGSIGLDIALGIGGYPRGRVIEIYGPESSGKTTLTGAIGEINSKQQWIRMSLKPDVNDEAYIYSNDQSQYRLFDDQVSSRIASTSATIF